MEQLNCLVQRWSREVHSTQVELRELREGRGVGSDGATKLVIIEYEQSKGDRCKHLHRFVKRWSRETHRAQIETS